jgi:hypothetical protein
MRIQTALLFCIAALVAIPVTTRSEHDDKVQILILGDSTAEGSIPRKLVPEGPHLEDVIRQVYVLYGLTEAEVRIVEGAVK